MRHVVNFGLLFCFVTLAVTGLLAFLKPFSIATTRVHIVFGLATLVLVGLHLASRMGYFKKQIRPSGSQQVSRPLLFGILAGWGGLIAVALVNWQPISLLLDQSYEARHQAEIVRASPLSAFKDPAVHQRMIARKPRSDADATLALSVSFARDLESLPAIAVWAETATGTMIETLYIDPALAYSDNPEWGGASVPRHHILPIWRHRYTMISGVDPTGEIDAFSGATPTHSFTLDDYLTLGEEKSFVLSVEVNAPADSNEHYTDSRIGQPSLLYTAYIELDVENRYTILELTGHGEGSERNGAIHYDLEKITTARALIDLLLVKVESTEK
ncbi:MAG: hypothetical protein ACI9R3_004254 [Verrucomicrobiales bacterium]|jgi:hypothetical protein